MASAGCGPKRPGPACQADAARLVVGGDETVQLFATVGGDGPTVRDSTRRDGEQPSSHDQGMASSEATSGAADAQCLEKKPTSKDSSRISQVNHVLGKR
jgi:hypothetical protein